MFNNLTNEKEKEKPNNHPQGIAPSSRALPLAISEAHFFLKMFQSWNSKVELFLTWSFDQVPSTLSHSGLSLWCVTKSENPIEVSCRNNGLLTMLKRLRCEGLYTVNSLPLIRISDPDFLTAFQTTHNDTFGLPMFFESPVEIFHSSRSPYQQKKLRVHLGG